MTDRDALEAAAHTGGGRHHHRRKGGEMNGTQERTFELSLNWRALLFGFWNEPGRFSMYVGPLNFRWEWRDV